LLRQHVFVISDDANFARAIAARWQSEWRISISTHGSSDVREITGLESHSLAILGPVRDGALEPLLRKIETTGAAICVCSSAEEERSLALDHLTALFIPPGDARLDTLMMISSEIAKRLDAEARVHQAESSAELLQSESTLGRSMLEMRHVVNDALTSLLGNADLLLLSEDPLTPQSREQILTIRKMALRLSEIMKRFSSLAAGLDAVENASQTETSASVSLRFREV
jgi:signal transduction histidine kinase